jgi:tetratricopeptide (TPR) repeat protein
MYAYFGWRWDEALDFLRRAADCRERAAVHSGVAATEVNIGEVLTDRGQYDEAGLHIQRAKRLWSSTGERAGTAYATALLGRLAARTGREDEGLVLLRDAADQLRKLGERVYVQFAESLLAEAEAFAGDPRVALKLTKRLIDNAERELPLLHRVTAVALARLGRNGASAEIERSLTVARERGALYDVAAALDLSAALGDPEPTRLRERDEILARLGVQRLPSPRLAEPELAIAAPAIG